MDYQLYRVGKIWHYRFQINGARVQRSTRETVKYRAEQVADKAYRHARLWARGDTPVPSLRQLVVQWLEVHRPVVSHSHAKVVETFGRLHLYDLADIAVDEITTDQVEAARLEYLKTHAPASANQWLNVLKLLCRWAIRRKVIPALPWSVKSLKLQKRPRAILPAALAKQWLHEIDAIDGERGVVAIAVRLMLGMGLRESETITARWEWVDWERRTYTPGITKGREADALPIPDWLFEYLEVIRAASGPVITRPDGSSCAPGFTRKAMNAANHAVGAGHITPHRLRGTFATLLSEEGAPIQMVQRAMRHKSVNTTMAYLEVNMSLVARAQERIARNAGLDAMHMPKDGGEEMANDIGETRDASDVQD